MKNELINTRLKQAGMIAMYLLCALLAVGIIIGLKALPSIGDSATDQSRVISVTGHSEIEAVPDVATFNWTVSSTGKTVEEAQNKAADISNKAIAYLKQSGVSADDINNQSYNTSEMYDYNAPCQVAPAAEPAVSGSGAARSSIVPVNPCPKVTGYTTNQTVEVKLRNVKQGDTKISELVAGVGQYGVKPSSVYYTFADQNVLQQQARVQAVAKAREQAEQIASALGVKLKKVESYTESYGGGYPMPYARDMAVSSQAKGSVIAPEIPNGKQTISADVTVSYSIR